MILARYTVSGVTPVEFLLARIAEDEARARCAAVLDRFADRLDVEQDAGVWAPARVLADCAAKRRIVELYQRADADERAELLFVNAFEQVVRLMTVPYAAHPDFDPTWQE
jgi:hypothetical protein